MTLDEGIKCLVSKGEVRIEAPTDRELDAIIYQLETVSPMPLSIVERSCNTDPCYARIRLFRMTKEGEKLRALIRKSLTELGKGLDEFEQTTHASFWATGDLDSVSKALEEAYRRPGSFTASELSQCIYKFLKGQTC